MIEMRAPSRLPPAPAPPHDPFSVMLAGHIGGAADVGWRLRAKARVDFHLSTRALVLSPAPSTARWLTEPTGTFGGLRLPPNVAVSAAGDVLLIDPDSGELKQFDACACRFVPLTCVATVERPAPPCATPPVSRGRHDRWLDPRAVAVCGTDLFVADRGHQRVLRYAVGSWVPRGMVRLPLAQRAGLIGGRWNPTGLAFAGRTLIVVDPDNGRVDRFDMAGRWLDTVAVPPAAGRVAHVAVDCQNRLYLLVEQTFTQAVAIAAAPVTLEIDSQRQAFHWHTVTLSQIPPGSRFEIDIHTGDEPWSAAHLVDPMNAEWARWLRADAVGLALQPQPIAGRLGRYLRVRFVPEAGSAAGAFDATARGAAAARIETGAVVYLPGARADVIEEFGTAPVPVDLKGHLHLPCARGLEVFDRRGVPVPPESRAGGEKFEREGTFLCTRLDSGIDGCQWHRIELRGAIPSGCSVEVRTATAGLAFTPDELPGSAWRSSGVAEMMESSDRTDPSKCAWDTLVRSSPGRYLWLELILRGDGRQTPCVSAAVIEYPRISLRRYLPSVFSFDPAGADFTDRFTAIFDRTLRSMEARLDALPYLLDPLSTPAEAPPGETDFLTWLSDWIGVTLAREWTAERRRHYLKRVARLYCRRGTPEGLRQQLLLLLGFDRAYEQRCLAERPQRHCVRPARDCDAGPDRSAAQPPPLILEHFKLRRWLYAGRGRLGSESLLWGKCIVNRSELSGDALPPTGNAQLGVTALDTVPDPMRDPFHVYAHRFSVFVPARIRDDVSERRALEQLLARETPAHTVADIRYVEPRFRVGLQATIGLDSVIARTPRGVTVDRARLGQGTVLSGRPHAPGLQVGKARVGSTTRLT